MIPSYMLNGLPRNERVTGFSSTAKLHNYIHLSSAPTDSFGAPSFGDPVTICFSLKVLITLTQVSMLTLLPSNVMLCLSLQNGAIAVNSSPTWASPEPQPSARGVYSLFPEHSFCFLLSALAFAWTLPSLPFFPARQALPILSSAQILSTL